MQARPALVLVGAIALVLVVVATAYALTSGDDDGATINSPDGNGAGGDNGEAGATSTPRTTPHTEAVVSAHDLATQSGVAILEQGGTAADAAVAVAATLSVVEPWFSSVLGGGTWGLHYDAEANEVTSLDGVGPTGSNATIEDFSQRAGSGGIHQSIVPGAWDGWMLWLQRYGTMDLRDVLQPAIDIAREGYTINADMASWLERSDIAGRPDTAEIYAPDGVVLGEGATVTQDDLADTFEALATAYEDALSDGRDAAIQAARDYYYRGPLAEAIVAFSDANGGYLTLDDFAGFEAAIVDPISIDWYDEITVFQNPPNSQGITQLIALNILKGMDFAGLEPHDPEALHMQIEALKLAFADRHHHVGDPARVDVPVQQLLSDEYADQQRARIDMGSAMQWPIQDNSEFDQPLEEDIGDTSTFHVVDSDGNAVAVTTSLGAQFLVVGDTGINMNNRMRFLALEDGDPNQLTPGYKVRHTSNPYMAFRNGRPYILGGNTGVDTQSQAQLHQFINIVEFGFSAQEAVSTPRFIVESFPATTYPYAAPNTLGVEDGFPAATIDALEALGHDTVVGGGTTGTAGVLILSEDGETIDMGAEDRNDVASGVVLPRD